MEKSKLPGLLFFYEKSPRRKLRGENLFLFNNLSVHIKYPIKESFCVIP